LVPATSPNTSGGVVSAGVAATTVKPTMPTGDTFPALSVARKCTMCDPTSVTSNGPV
jgi:hypothetical protein